SLVIRQTLVGDDYGPGNLTFVNYLQTANDQKLSGTTSRTPGTAWSCCATSRVIGSSTATNATASPPASGRPRLKVAMLILFSPSRGPSAPMKPGASSLTM